MKMKMEMEMENEKFLKRSVFLKLKSSSILYGTLYILHDIRYI
jgi:hypothetical protein